MKIRSVCTGREGANQPAHKKNAPQDCEAKLSWLFRTYGGSDLYGHLTPIKTTSADFKYKPR